VKKKHRNDIADLRKIKLPYKGARYHADLPTIKLPSIRAKPHADNNREFVHLAGKGLFLGVFIGLAIFGIFYAWSWSISTGKAQPETFTELSFEDNLHLPSEVIPRHPYFFQFTLHNVEGKDMEYSYEVYVEVGQDRLIFDKGTVFVNENDYKTIQERFATASVLPKSEIVVDLINKNQQIDFWIDGAG
jgi:hypothetical protein